MDPFPIPTQYSRKLAERLQAVLPGGDTRGSTFYLPYPLALARGDGYRVWDVDGNEFIDFLGNFGVLIHGYNHPAITNALRDQLELGTVFPAPTESQAELAERICGRFDSIERLRFTNSGSEAVILALRAARAFTGRSEVLKADGGYHGCWEQLPMTAGAGNDRGIPEPVSRLVHTIDYNASEQLRAVMKTHGNRICALVFEPMLAGGGVIPGDREFFETARELADHYGALLVFDEVFSGRLHVKGYQAVLGVRPDLTTLGKIIGGGLPVGAVGGRADVMDSFNPRLANHVPMSGTFNGNSLTMVAGLVSLDLATAEEIDRINALGATFAEGLRATVEAVGVDSIVTQCGSFVQVHFEVPPAVETFRDTNLRSEVLRRFHSAALGFGIYCAPRGLFCTSTPMTDDVIEDALDALAKGVEVVGGHLHHAQHVR